MLDDFAAFTRYSNIIVANCFKGLSKHREVVGHCGFSLNFKEGLHEIFGHPHVL